jgi:RNA polymerase sigma-70 factor (ECF subfamily)
MQHPSDACLLPLSRGDSKERDVDAGTASAVIPVLEPSVEGRRFGLEPSDGEREAERTLVRAVRRREPRAGERLYDQLIDAIDRAIARTLGRGQPEHDDLVQATFEQVVITLTDGTFLHECSLKSWAVSIASHLSLNAIRSRTRERAVFDTGLGIENRPGLSATSSVERTVETRRTLAQMREELSSMNESRARALILFHVFEYDLKQVAGTLGISVAAAQSRIVRGRRELLARMEKRPGRCEDG